MQWNAVTPGVSPGGDILGYKLTVTDPTSGTSWVAFDGQELGLPDQLQYTVYGLTTGKSYLFSVLAYSFNGEGIESAQVEFYSCQAPSVADPPTRITSTTTSITLQWSSPSTNGGCPVTSFAVFSDNGDGLTFSEVN